VWPVGSAGWCATGLPARLLEVRPKVLYIAGSTRTGSTLIGQILGEIPGWFDCGELKLIWLNRVCGCGTRVHECGVWKPVLDRVLSEDEDLTIGLMVLTQVRHVRPRPDKLRAIARLARAKGEGIESEVSYRDGYARAQERLYEAICERTGAGVVVDSSKNPADAYLLAQLTDVDLHVLHLVRDPRAVAYACGKDKALTGLPGRYMRLGAARGSLDWLRSHALIEAVLRPKLASRYQRLRYEDFVADPRAALQAVCDQVGLPDAELPFSGPRTVRLGPNHTVAGNTNRFTGGEVEIRVDDAWTSRIDPRTRAVATICSAPLMRRYGYRVLRAKSPA
jgi:hypothetical protein